MTIYLYAGLLGLMFLALSLYVISRRWKHKIAMGDGENKEMRQAIRCHANFAEYVPMMLVLLFLSEFEGAPDWLIHIFGICLIVGRSLHFIGLSKHTGTSRGRFFGMILTFTSLAGAALTCLFYYLAQL